MLSISSLVVLKYVAFYAWTVNPKWFNHVFHPVRMSKWKYQENRAEQMDTTILMPLIIEDWLLSRRTKRTRTLRRRHKKIVLFNAESLVATIVRLLGTMGMVSFYNQCYNESRMEP